MNSFSNLKRSRENIDKLTKAIDDSQKRGFADADDRLWQPTLDKAGNGFAVIRFLPAPPVDGEDGLPWVRMWTHNFQGPGGWLIENCLTTIDQKCPVCELNSALWNTGSKEKQDIARKRKRKLTYTTNILILSEPAHPEYDYTLKIFKFGKKIFDKISEIMNPKFQDEQPINPFDFWTGANLKLKVCTIGGFRNYDASVFSAPSRLFDGDDQKLEALWKTQYSLKEFVDPKKFKTYTQVKERLTKVLGTFGPTTKLEVDEVFPATSKSGFEEPTQAAEAIVETPVAALLGDEDDTDMQFFKDLADDSE